MPDQEFQILITSDADNSGFKSAAAESQALAHEMGVINVSNEDIEKATRKTTDAVKEGTEKFGESRREIREVGNELGRATGVSHLGGLFLGGVAAAAFGAGKAIEFLKTSWETLAESIKGPIEVGLPENAPAHISAAAAAWQQYATARTAAMASANGAEGTASREEKKLANELKLIHEVLAAEKEKALADLELHKGEMTPEEYKASRENIGNIFGEAGTKADEASRQQQNATKEREAFRLEREARQKTEEALGIKSAPKAVAENNQKKLDENAAKAEVAKKEIDERIAMIDRRLKAAHGGDVPEYTGSFGKIQQGYEEGALYGRYGLEYMEDARKVEETRRSQAQAQIDVARSYREREGENSEKKKKLMEEAGAASGKASNLRGEIGDDKAAAAAQHSVDAHVAQLHQSSVNQTVAASRQTVQAVQYFTAATVGGFADVHAQFVNHQSQLNELRGQIRSLPQSRR